MTTGSVVVRKSLGRQLKALRLSAGKSTADVATSGVSSTSKLQRIEAGSAPVKLVDVWGLCRLYGVDEATTDRLAEMAKNSSEKGWWEEYGGIIPAWFSTYVELEAAASRLLAYDPELVHGLLQTPAYHRALIAVDPERSAESADEQIRLRGQRQNAAFDRLQPLQVTVILGEGALARLVGGAEVMAEQKLRLLEVSQQNNVDVRVLTWDAGAHVAMKGAFNVLTFDTDDEHPDIVYLETLAGGRYIEDEDIAARYQRNFGLILDQSISIREYMQ
jgi:transcriptional regulator with XRE-family HTH domain